MTEHTTKNKGSLSKSSMNLVPVLLISILIVSAGYLLLKDTLQLPWFKTEKTMEITRLVGYPTTIETQKDLKKTRMVLKSSDELRNYLQSIDIVDEEAYNQLNSQVDFAKETLIAASSDTQEETESTIKIKRVALDRDNNVLAVTIVQSKPDATCIPEIKKNILVDFVKITKTDKEFDFDAIKETRSCN
ncbi:hypothetical protein A2709_01920 [candidate division WWE3 bacterium RIFCSPHIGHO2_01_FULL_43_9]|uniref:Uncharacterized protein n=2 Tax=Katanobacteria TaxID=422282 RepID=A0A1F4V222_UNCKA|nr:MAG: hypothetical protein A2709_01920 [candidate division WWE3 bacterium RIFCSPHIGHO2_01_FULL_43_9]